MAAMTGPRPRPVPPAPSLEPISHISPSSAAELLRCPLRVAFQRSRQHRIGVTGNPAAMLGIICHAVLERVGKGEILSRPRDEWPKAIDELWDRSLTEMAGLLPPDSRPDRWPYYHLKRAQVRRVGVDLAESLAVAARQGAPQPLFEWSMVGYGGKLVGKADRVVPEAAGVIVEDFKSGSIFEPGSQIDQEEPQLKEDYRRQLLLYAALYHEETGMWPVAGRVVALDGGPLSQEIDPGIASETAEQALRLLETYNQSVATKSAWDLGTPSPAVCAFCPYKGVCDPYWANVSPDWAPPDRPAMEGQINTVTTLRDGTISIVCDADAGNVPLGSWRILGLTEEQTEGMAIALDNGLRVRLVHLRGHTDEAEHQLYAGPATEIWLMGQQ